MSRKRKIIRPSFSVGDYVDINSLYSFRVIEIKYMLSEWQYLGVVYKNDIQQVRLCGYMRDEVLASGTAAKVRFSSDFVYATREAQCHQKKS